VSQGSAGRRRSPALELHHSPKSHSAPLSTAPIVKSQIGFTDEDGVEHQRETDQDGRQKLHLAAVPESDEADRAEHQADHQGGGVEVDHRATSISLTIDRLRRDEHSSSSRAPELAAAAALATATGGRRSDGALGRLRTDRSSR
jgi:hypothetical protein